MNDKNYSMDRIYRILMNSSELTDADLRYLPIGAMDLNGEYDARELLMIYEKLGEVQKKSLMKFAKQCLKEESGSMT
ncbi:hypothetical protein [Anaerosolibacter sp.]|uniref:hypothetical protein n=1 Tax=Anaerosolibacter sp. TaxID=1872527 RepID=UPI0039EEFB93